MHYYCGILWLTRLKQLEDTAAQQRAISPEEMVVFKLGCLILNLCRFVEKRACRKMS